jgi:hypothetical protein
MQLVLEVLVHDVDQAVAETPEQEQRAHQAKGEREVPTLLISEPTRS